MRRATSFGVELHLRDVLTLARALDADVALLLHDRDQIGNTRLRGFVLHHNLGEGPVERRSVHAWVDDERRHDTVAAALSMSCSEIVEEVADEGTSVVASDGLHPLAPPTRSMQTRSAPGRNDIRPKSILADAPDPGASVILRCGVHSGNVVAGADVAIFRAGPVRGRYSHVR